MKAFKKMLLAGLFALAFAAGAGLAPTGLGTDNVAQACDSAGCRPD